MSKRVLRVPTGFPFFSIRLARNRCDVASQVFMQVSKKSVFVNPEANRANHRHNGSAPTPTHDAMGVDGDASTGDTRDLRDVRLHARQPFHLRLDVAFGLVHAVTCGIAYGPLGAMDGEGAFERVFVVGLGAIAHALVALSTHWSVRHPRRIHVTLIAHTRSSSRSLGAHFRRPPNLFDDTTDLLRPRSPHSNRSPPRLRSRAGRSRRRRQSAWPRHLTHSRSSPPPTAVRALCKLQVSITAPPGDAFPNEDKDGARRLVLNAAVVRAQEPRVPPR